MGIFSLLEDTNMSQMFMDFSRASADAVQKAGAYTVMVEGRRRNAASGVLYRKDLVLSASHAVERDHDIRVTLPNGGVASAVIAGRDPGHDLVLLRVSPASEVMATVAAKEPRVGEFALSVARTQFDGINATFGIVNAAGARLPFWKGGVIERYFQTDAPRYPGFSGGPVADTEGEMLGINVFGHRFGTALTIPSRLAFEIGSRLLEHGSVKRGRLGIRSQLVELPSAARGTVGGTQQGGLLIVGVEEGSAAETAGMMLGDVLVRFDGKAIESHEKLMGLLGQESVGRKITADVLRGGVLQPLAVTVASIA
jgi:S1-C subfamily serine protease